MNRVSINYLNRFKESIADASAHLRRLVKLHSDDKQLIDVKYNNKLRYIKFKKYDGDSILKKEDDIDMEEISVDEKVKDKKSGYRSL